VGYHLGRKAIGFGLLCWLLGLSVLKQAKKESDHYLITCHLHVGWRGNGAARALFHAFWERISPEQIQEEMAAGALVSPPGWEAALCQVLPALFRRVPLRSDLATSCWQAPCWLVRAIHEDDGSRVTLCGHTCCSRRWETAPLLPGVQAYRLHQPTSDPACRLFPSPVRVLPIVIPPSRATLVVRR